MRCREIAQTGPSYYNCTVTRYIFFPPPLSARYINYNINTAVADPVGAAYIPKSTAAFVKRFPSTNGAAGLARDEELVFRCIPNLLLHSLSYLELGSYHPLYRTLFSYTQRGHIYSHRRKSQNVAAPVLLVSHSPTCTHHTSLLLFLLENYKYYLYLVLVFL